MAEPPRRLPRLPDQFPDRHLEQARAPEEKQQLLPHAPANEDASTEESVDRALVRGDEDRDLVKLEARGRGAGSVT